MSHGETVRVGCILDHLYRVSRRPLFPGHVLFSPDMSSFPRTCPLFPGHVLFSRPKKTSGIICVSLGLSQTSYSALTSFGKGISWLDYTTATASGHAAASTDSFWFIVPQGLCVLQSNSRQNTRRSNVVCRRRP